MKYNPGENYKLWLERVRLHELGEAYKRMAKGEDIVKVLERMARNITEKGLYPLLKSIKDPKES